MGKDMAKKNIPIDSIDGYVCIVNKTPVNIERDDEWYASHIKPIHISELLEVLEDWVASCSGETMYLDMLTEVAKAQIKLAEHTEKTLRTFICKGTFSKGGFL